MNRIETKIIIMVTNRLAEAKDSDAKTEMIEELSENMYQRYLELAAGGVPEEEALQRAMESLGDVAELLAYLKEEEEASAAAKETVHERAFQEKEASRAEGTSSFFKDDLESGIEEIVNAAFSTARVAMDCARDVAEQFKESYPEGVFNQFTARRGQKVDYTSIMPEKVHSLEIRLINGNINISCADEADALIEVSGDTEEIEMMLKDEEILSISQGNTASAAYFFMRGMRRSDIEVRLPKKVWNHIRVSTVNGDIRIEDELECGELNVSTTSGDLDMKRISCSNMIFRSGSGDMIGKELNGNLHGKTKSGNIEMSGVYGQCELSSASGDVRFEGTGKELHCSSTSGNVELNLEKIPERTEANSISGNCRLKVPAENSFHVSYHTVSGKFMTNIELTGMSGEKSGDAVWGNGSRGEIRLSSVSGDVEVNVMEREV